LKKTHIINGKETAIEFNRLRSLLKILNALARMRYKS